MNEQEPVIEIKLSGEAFEMTRANSFLYTFIGNRAIFNHIWLKRDDLPQPEDENLIPSTYLFETLTFDTQADLVRWREVYEAIVDQMIANEFPLFMNMPNPSETDVNAYIGAAMKDDVFDFVPISWEKEF